MSFEAIEIEAVMAGDDNGKSHCLVVPNSPFIDAKKSKLLVKTVDAEFEFAGYDESTARTEVSTDIDDMFSLHDKFSFGSLHLDDSGSFNPPTSSFDASRIARVRSKQGDLLRIAELNEAMNEKQSREYKKASLLDFDDDDDDSSEGGIKTTLGTKLSAESQVNVYGSDRSNFTSVGSIVGDSLRRDDFYTGYRDILQNSDRIREDFYGANGRANAASTGSMFAKGTLNTDSRIGFYRVACSDSEEPLSCRQKMEQPALSCDSNLWSPNHKKKVTQKDDNVRGEEDRIGSLFSAITRCFMPSEP